MLSQRGAAILEGMYNEYRYNYLKDNPGAAEKEIENGFLTQTLIGICVDSGTPIKNWKYFMNVSVTIQSL